MRRRTNLAPIPMECDAPYLKVTGELPRELNGTLYRNGPNPQFDAPGAHWFVGDGMLHAFHLENGRASPIATAGSAPRNGRPSTTPAARCSAASAASCRTRPPTSPRTAASPTPTSSSTPAACWRWKKAHLPTEIEPGTLATRGYCNYGGGIAGPFTAHPKIDPSTGEMVFFGYNAVGTALRPPSPSAPSAPRAN